MKTSQFIFVLLCLGLGACSAKVESKGETVDLSPKPAPQPQSPDFSFLNGKWATGCVSYQGYYLSDNVTLNNGQFETNTGIFSDSKCLKAMMAPQQSKGNIVYVSGDLASIVAIDFYADLGNGAQQINHDLFQYSTDRFYLGDQNSVDSTTLRPTKIDYKRPYFKVP